MSRLTNAPLLLTFLGMLNAHNFLLPTLWDANCRPVYNFGSGSYSMVTPFLPTALSSTAALQSTLWDANCRPVYDFGSGPFSMVRWNHFSRFISLMGFGNLPGKTKPLF